MHRAIFDQARHNIGEQQRMMVRDLKFLLEDNRDYTVSVFVPRTKSHSIPLRNSEAISFLKKKLDSFSLICHDFF